MSSLINELLSEDALIQDKASKIPPEDTQKVMETLMERHRLYYKYESMASSKGDSDTTFKINTMRQDLFLQVMIYKLKIDTEGDIAKIFTRLDTLETKIRDLEPKK